MEQVQNEWVVADEGWRNFCATHPELDLRPSKWAFNNFLRSTREKLLDADAIRKAKGKHWIIHTERFDTAAFDLLTGKDLPDGIEMALRRLGREMITLNDCCRALDPDMDAVEFNGYVNSLPDSEKPERHGAFNAGGQMTFNLPAAIQWCRRINDLQMSRGR